MIVIVGGVAAFPHKAHLVYRLIRFSDLGRHLNLILLVICQSELKLELVGLTELNVFSWDSIVEQSEQQVVIDKTGLHRAKDLLISN